MNALAERVEASAHLLAQLGDAIVERDAAEACRMHAQELAKAWNRAAPYLPQRDPPIASLHEGP